MSGLAIIDQHSASLEDRWRDAKALASADLVPAAFKGNPANVMLVIALAKHIGAEPFMVMQNADVIHGKVALRATYLIGCVNNSKRFTTLRFKYEGEGKERSCHAWARELATGDVIEGPRVSVAMADAEGWSTKAGSKWKTMPDVMLAYRAGAFFSRLYASDITLGMHTTDEVEDMPAERWQGVPDAVVEPVEPDPMAASFEAVLAAEQWTPKQRTALRTRYANADAEGRAKLVADAQAQLVEVAE
jgi:hypothetical protein